MHKETTMGNHETHEIHEKGKTWEIMTGRLIKMNLIFLSHIFLSNALIFFRVFRVFRGFPLFSIAIAVPSKPASVP
jgi:hypothetical protein